MRVVEIDSTDLNLVCDEVVHEVTGDDTVYVVDRVSTRRGRVSIYSDFRFLVDTVYLDDVTDIAVLYVGISAIYRYVLYGVVEIRMFDVETTVTDEI